jgi:hypothetical protein
MNASERERRVQDLLAQRLSQNAIARISGIPRRTVQRIIKRLDQRRASIPSVRFAPNPDDRSAHRFEQRADDLRGTIPVPAAEGRREETGLAATPSNQPPQEPGHLLGEEGLREEAEAVGAEAAAPRPERSESPRGQATGSGWPSWRTFDLTVEEERHAEERAMGQPCGGAGLC